jgi:hypothetical protein
MPSFFQRIIDVQYTINTNKCNLTYLTLVIQYSVDTHDGDHPACVNAQLAQNTTIAHGRGHSIRNLFAPLSLSISLLPEATQRSRQGYKIRDLIRKHPL